jgi:hypothetical protein
MTVGREVRGGAEGRWGGDWGGVGGLGGRGSGGGGGGQVVVDDGSSLEWELGSEATASSGSFERL